jgi:hypothetical protein
VPIIEAWLEEIGVVRLANESLAETTMRAMGITGEELREELQRRAFAVVQE